MLSDNKYFSVTSTSKSVTQFSDEVSAEPLNTPSNFGEKNPNIQSRIFRLPCNVARNKTILKIVASLNFIAVALRSAK